MDELLENEATAPVWSVPATVRTCGRTAGTLGRLPRARSLPTAATTSEPVPKAALTRSSSTWLRATPRLRLITPGALSDRGVEPGDHAGRRQRALGVGVPGAQDGLRVDADDAGRVRRRADDGADRGPVRVAVAGAEHLGVQRFRARPPGELRVRQVEAGVDHGDRLARARRLGAVGADHLDPPLGRDERVARGDVADDAYGAVGLGGADEPGARGGPAGSARAAGVRRRQIPKRRETGLPPASARATSARRPPVTSTTANGWPPSGCTAAAGAAARSRSSSSAARDGWAPAAERGAHESEGDQDPEAQAGQNSSDAGISRRRRQSRGAGRRPSRARSSCSARAGRRRGRGRLDPAGHRSGRASSSSRASSTAPSPSRPSSPRASCSSGCWRWSCALGRTRDGPRFGPRTIDLDLLVYGDVERRRARADRPASTAGRAAASCSSRSPSSTPSS